MFYSERVLVIVTNLFFDVFCREEGDGRAELEFFLKVGKIRRRFWLFGIRVIVL